jgi:hypothetical protein
MLQDPVGLDFVVGVFTHYVPGHNPRAGQAIDEIIVPFGGRLSGN